MIQTVELEFGCRLGIFVQKFYAHLEMLLQRGLARPKQVDSMARSTNIIECKSLVIKMSSGVCVHFDSTSYVRHDSHMYEP